MKDILETMEQLIRPSGAFIAASSNDYRACWIRDQLYGSFAYYYLGDFEKLKKGIRVVFDILNKHRWKLENYEILHAKYNADDFGEITENWGHYQLDAIGLFLHIVADLDFKNVSVIRNKNDSEIIQFLVFYLDHLRYWHDPDNGMWEENKDLHGSSIGAVVAGLSYIKRRQIAVVPERTISLGREALNRLLPNESPERDVDMAQLSLIWPYNIVSKETADTILARVKEKLVQKHGLNRYWGDNYFRSKNGVSAEWPMGFFWLSIIASQRHGAKEAQQWFRMGMAQAINDSYIPELYQDDRPNKHTPLAWAHGMALIAKAKLESEMIKTN